MIAVVILGLILILILPNFRTLWSSPRRKSNRKEYQRYAEEEQAKLQEMAGISHQLRADTHALADELSARNLTDGEEHSSSGSLIQVEVHGEAQRNPDGISRQDIIARLKEGEYITLVPEPENPHDSNAVRVDSDLGTIGYVARDEAAEICKLVQEGRVKKSYIDNISGGYGPHKNRGIWLMLETN